MKNLVWINWLINNPVFMWTILGLTIGLPILALVIIGITNKIYDRKYKNYFKKNKEKKINGKINNKE